MSDRVARQRRGALAIVATGATVMAVWAAAHLAGYRYNRTPSYPIGIYRITADPSALHRGDLVIACPTRSPVITEARERGYLARGWCESGTVPVIKKVAALPGDRVVVGDVLEVNGTPWPRSRPLTRDGMGRPMMTYAGGVIPKDEVLLLSDYNSESFDGRYFGPIPLSSVEGRIRLVRRL